MADNIKPISNVSIKFEDGTRSKMEAYALVGLSEGTWYKVMLSPAKQSAKIDMNNKLVELSNGLLKSIKQ